MKKYIALILLSLSVLVITSCDNAPEAPPLVEEDAGAAEEVAPKDEEQEIGVGPGMLAPDFTVVGRDGEEISLSDYKGKITFLNFWATSCPYCIDEMPDLEAFYNAHKDEDDFALVGLNMTKTWEKQSKDSLVDWLDSEGLTFPVGFDLDGELAADWSARSLPMTFVIDETGTSLGAIMGKTDIQTLEGVLNQVRAPKQ